MIPSSLYVLLYDIADDRRRTRLHDKLREYGVTVQESAFEARLTGVEHRELLRQVEGIVDASADRFVCYPVGGSQERRIVALGLPRPEIVRRSYVMV